MEVEYQIASNEHFENEIGHETPINNLKTWYITLNSTEYAAI